MPLFKLYAGTTMGKLRLRAFYSITKEVFDYAWGIIGEHLKAEEGKQTKKSSAFWIYRREAGRQNFLVFEWKLATIFN